MARKYKDIEKEILADPVQRAEVERDELEMRVDMRRADKEFEARRKRLLAGNRDALERLAK